MKYRFIGDVHGLFSKYEKIIEESPHQTIQVGDFGLGFGNDPGPPFQKMLTGGHRFIRGNHDSPDECKKVSQWIPDGTTETTPSGTKIMYIGGAWSIDQAFRTPGKSWWPDEELWLYEWDKLLPVYYSFQPDIIVTHDCPESISKNMFIEGTHKPVYKSRTGQALDAMLSVHRPKIWIFGHWHINQINVINGTRFICLDELQCLDIEM